ncbi:DNA polymerase III subunit gamma and tau [Streptantibioticus ferralitis]|uniref:DNA polymerase III subunit gamma/tau n=1 Tax=Streptantibioticus ferralitis TaxID=236510 RepID=A0ABT5Z0B7_9ACTN|nr:DNA polymerase III subunit gamma and tau [Streptantibioticus ferralitis]MDF2257277.1 DNA polymerase III subunit gamma and tau [Streptantibioticus ferralitis]
MSLALYRRYRPETFAEVIGQEHVTDPLQQALRNNRVNHAYLFSGPRGCGKTTSARILARCLNCEQGPTPTPCGECQSCRDLARGGPGSIDVIEIDAASHGGVDDARDLREKAFFGPASSRYKIYIIDEAHMVTSAGFNALLKVVEEPPEHLKFIFATTEPEKVIGTIRSRTHHYPFRLVPPGTLRDYLAEVCARESIPVEDGVFPLVVRAGAGSVRDSMSVMDQLLAGAGEGGVTYAMATALLGYTDGALLDDIVDAFAAGDGAAAFEMVDRVIEGGHDPRRFVADLLERLRDLVILAAVPDAGEKGLIDAPADVVERMAAQASVFGAAELSRAADLVNAGLTEMRGATSPRLQLELICARVLLPAAYDDERAVQARLDRLERQALTGGLAAAGPAVGYVPQSDAHAGGVSAGPAAARAAVRPGSGGPDAGTGTGAGPQPQGPPAAAPAEATAPPAQGAPGSWPTGVRQRPDDAGASAPAPAPAPASAPTPAPGAWPTGTQSAAPAAASGGESGHRPGAWPGAGAPSTPAASAAPATPAAQPAAAAPAAPPVGDPSRVRQMWPDILEAVKNRRRFTWILLSQNAQVVGFDGSTLQLGFANPGARDSFVNGGSDEVLRQAVSDALGVQWKIEAIVDPSGGAGGPGQGGPSSPGGFGGPSGGQGGFGGGAPASTSGGGFGGDSRPAAPTPAPARSAPPATPEHVPPAQSASAPAPQAPPRVSIEDDIPEEDDPDLDDTALTGHDLIVRELGATVIEEITNE